MDVKKIIQIATAITMVDGHDIKRTVCVDEEGVAWELAPGGHKWIKLPPLPAA